MAGPADLFGDIAADYDRLRPQDEGWQEVFEAIWSAGELASCRILDVGCGTGALATAMADRGARVWGVDSSPEMLAQARRRGSRHVGFKLGEAEELPFRSGWFDRAVMRCVVHLVDRSRALPELHRVLGPAGTAVVATFTPRHFELIWLARFFPSIAEVDRRRFPEPSLLADELRAAGFDATRIVELTQRASIEREAALERLRGRYISTLSLIPEDEYVAGLERAERELRPATGYGVEWAIVTADRVA